MDESENVSLCAQQQQLWETTVLKQNCMHVCVRVCVCRPRTWLPRDCATLKDTMITQVGGSWFSLPKPLVWHNQRTRRVN